MAVRIKDWIIPYTWWTWIEITDNHVINVLLRAANNLIQVNEDRELYVDLQLPDGIEPDDDFPVGVTTGRILAEDWRDQNGTILNRKTTSWDYVRLIYAADGNLYYDPWTWNWIMIGVAETIDVNTKTFFLSSNNDVTTAQAAIDYIRSGKNALLMLNYWNGYWNTTLGSCCTLTKVYFDESPEIPQGFMAYDFCDSIDTNNIRNCIRVAVDVQTWEVLAMYRWNLNLDDSYVMTHYAQTIAGTKTFTTSPVVPSKDTAAGNNPTSIATEAQVYLKQDKLTAWSWITIDSNTNTISANIQWALVFKGTVADVASLPSSWNTVWDTYYVTADGLMYSWDWTQWLAVGNTQIDLSNYFDMTVNTTDDITEWTNLFVTQAMIDAWNNKQWALTAWTNIQISNNVISATDTTYTAGTWISITNGAINNTLPFDPENAGSVGQVLKRTSTWARRANETPVLENVFVTQAEYDALPSSKESDWKSYFIYS